MNKPVDFPVARIAGHEDENSNDSANPSFSEVLDARLSRRSLLRGGVGTAAAAVLGGLGLSACGGGGDAVAATEGAQGAAGQPYGLNPIRSLNFTPVAKSIADMVTVPAEYDYSVLIALGDPLDAATPNYKNDGTDTDFDHRSGDHHDGMEYFGLSASGKERDVNGSKRGLLVMNHEATSHPGGWRPSIFIHATGGTNTAVRPAAEVEKEFGIHGLAVVEVRKADGKFEYVRASGYNRRITPLTPVEVSGPLRGHPLMVTKYDPSGRTTRGTLNNCGTGYTPWGTYLSGEENWAGYFTRSAVDDAARGNDKSTVGLRRYGRAQGAASRHGWETPVDPANADRYARWNIGKTGASVDGSDDYRNELNGMGWVAELDPYDPLAPVKKRSALGRFAHESAVFGPRQPGKPLAVYLGDDSQGEYMYKFVSDAKWTPADAEPQNRLAAGDKFLDQGKLYVAKYHADGTGEWIELTIANPAIAGYAAYAFADQVDVLVHARLAADAVGATKMDRPEWCAVNPANGEVYVTMTNNSNRKVEPSGTQFGLDAANPRAYVDRDGPGTSQGNVNGHIIRMAEQGGESSATSFSWDVYLFGAEADSLAGVNLSGLSDAQDFSSPDGLWFSPCTGVCWIQTDDGAYTNQTNCMMLAGLPGQVGDGEKQTLTYTKGDGSTVAVDTYVGAKPAADRLARFLVGPVDCEITGCTETPDGKALFVNIQHPGERTPVAALQAAGGDNTSAFISQWPANAGYGAGRRPRSATIVITRKDGGRVGE
ncbi:MAG TPA: PhoX family phosphatase [Methylibium sp.]|nr:PhoX family phosphatase [Methylibium sp.]